MANKKPIGGDHEPKTELRPGSTRHLGLARDANGTEPTLVQKMLDFRKGRLKAARRGPHMADVRQGTIRHRFAEDFGNNTIRYHQVPSRLLNSPTAEATKSVLVHRLCAARNNQDT